MVMTPASPQTASSQPEPPVSRAISAETMKMPEPIMIPATIIVLANSPRRCSSPPDDDLGSVDTATAARSFIAHPGDRRKRVGCKAISRKGRRQQGGEQIYK